MEIYKNKYIKYIFEEENSLVSYHWTTETENMTVESYKKNILLGIDYVTKYNPKFLLSDQRGKKFVVSPDLQEWNAKETLPKLFKQGVIKFAIIESEDFIIQLATEQTINEDKEKEYSVMFFASEDEAREWFSK